MNSKVKVGVMKELPHVQFLQRTLGALFLLALAAGYVTFLD